MKKVIHLTLLLVLPLLNGNALSQHHTPTQPGNVAPTAPARNGIFLNDDDLVNGTVSEVASTNQANDIVVDLDKKLILIREGNQRAYTFGKLSGYFKDGVVYRAYGSHKAFHNFGYYKVLDQGGMIVYSKAEAQPKTGTHTFYYYSATLDAPIRKFTKANLKEDFKNHPDFIAAVWAAHKNGTLFTTTGAHTQFTLLAQLHLTSRLR